MRAGREPPGRRARLLGVAIAVGAYGVAFGAASAPALGRAPAGRLRRRGPRRLAARAVPRRRSDRRHSGRGNQVDQLVPLVPLARTALLAGNRSEIVTRANPSKVGGVDAVVRSRVTLAVAVPCVAALVAAGVVVSGQGAG